MSGPSFRDFAGAIMGGDQVRASSVLQELLALSPDQATAATAHFASKSKDQAFMMKAMGLRTAVTSGSDDDIAALLGECFGLDPATRTASVAALRKRYPAA